MTRLAPSAPPQSEDGTPALLHAAWRVGARGSLSLCLHEQTTNGIEGVVTITSDDAASSTMRMCVQAVNAVFAYERAFAFVCDDSALRFTVTIVTLDSGQPLLLTDLPTQLGLMGGTYTVDSIRLGLPLRS